jgi:hypothetical protein
VPAGDAGGVQICDPGVVECATEYALKTCQNDGSEWVLTLCAANEVCSNGACVVNTQQECMPNTQMCQGSAGGLRCRDDGQGYEEFDCPPEAPCDGFKCRGEVCTPGESRCMDPADASPLGGTPLAVEGQLFASQSLFTCNADGSGWDVSSCGNDEICVFNGLTPTEVDAYEDAYAQWWFDVEMAMNSKDPVIPPAPPFIYPPNREMSASCVAPDCMFAMGDNGELVCGDPSDPAVDPISFYSRCQGMAPFQTPHWVPYTCEMPEVCDPSEIYYGTEDPCTTECQEGASMCDYYFGNNYDGFRVCVNGMWEPAVSCNPGSDQALTCYQRNGEPDFGEIPEALCVDPVCASLSWTWDNPDFTGPYYGVCEGEDVRLCNEVGILAEPADAVACDNGGACRDSTLSYYGSNELIGSCVAECTDGERRCLDQVFMQQYYGWGMSSTPFWVECVNGQWNLQYETCDDWAACFQTYTYAGDSEDIVTDVVCGGECQPDYRQCSEDGTGIETCQADSTWGAAVDCDVGSCINEHSNGWFWDAECVFQCVPGTYRQGLTHYQEDAMEYYYTVEQCGEDGLWGEAVRCPGTVNEVFIGPNWGLDQVGCFECYGPALAFYYDEPVESMCAEDGTVLWCGDDNMWPDAGEDCGQASTCYEWSSYPWPGASRAVCVDELPDGGIVLPVQ